MRAWIVLRGEIPSTRIGDTAVRGLSAGDDPQIYAPVFLDLDKALAWRAASDHPQAQVIEVSTDSPPKKVA